MKMNVIKRTVALSLSLFAFSPAFASWNLNDVSYLMPLPEKFDGSDNLLRMNSQGKGGALLPADMMGDLPPMVQMTEQEKIFAALRVISVRIDPCFPLPTPQACQKQIRLVWQPLELNRRGKIDALDTALHSFYVLSDDEFKAVLKDLAAWKSKYNVTTDGLPLQVHPAWAQQKDQSPALREFSTIIRKYAGARNLSRFTAMVLRGAGDMWAFMGFNVENGVPMMFPIARTQRSSQVFVNFAVPSDYFDQGQIAPNPMGDDTINTVVTNSKDFKMGNEETLRKELRAAFRIDDPHSFNPENMDCVSCHVAQIAQDWIIRNRSDIRVDDIWQQHAYKNANHNLSNVTNGQLNTHILRAFGYFNSDPAISNRVINESAEVADLINKYFVK